MDELARGLSWVLTWLVFYGKLHCLTLRMRRIRSLLTCRCIDADLGVCRLIRKAGIAVELLELPAIEFIDMFAVAVSLRLSFRHRVRKHNPHSTVKCSHAWQRTYLVLPV